MTIVSHERATGQAPDLYSGIPSTVGPRRVPANGAATATRQVTPLPSFESRKKTSSAETTGIH